jgi:hypothetical protein
MAEQIHLIGNGPSVHTTYNPNVKGLKMTCNLPPFPVKAFATAMVDFKIMRAIHAEELIVPGDWVLGIRPKMYFDKNPSMKIKYAPQIREFYCTIPKYIVDMNRKDGEKDPVGKSYTDFSCGHFAAHYLCNKFRPVNELHMYGFDSIFDFNLTSCSDFYLQSERDALNTSRLSTNWRRIWPHLFAEFPNTKFVLHSLHNAIKINVPKNVEIYLHR